MKAYEVVLQLYEGDEISDSFVVVITLAPNIEAASRNAVSLYTEADETTDGFRWEASSVTAMKGIVVIPKMNKIIQKI